MDAAATPRFSRPMEWAQYLSLRGLTSFMHAFSAEQNLRTAATVGSAFYRYHRRRRERAIGNIMRSFPDASREWAEQTAEASMQYMFQLFMVDALLTPRVVTPSGWPAHVRLHKSVGPVIERLVRGEPMILITGHCGNWELLGFFLSALGYSMSALARPLDNRLINNWLLSIREARGLRIITKWGATPVLQETIRRGGRVAFIADQNAGDGGMFVPFFGRLASSYKSIGLLAMRYGVPVVAGHAVRIDAGLRYEVRCADMFGPDDWRGQPDPLFYITARYNRAIEQMVRHAPEQYLWLHRRWKSRPRHERLGEPMPRRLAEKLQALPWMTDEQLDRLRRPAREILA